MLRFIAACFALATIWSFSAVPAHAVIMTYTDQASFLADLPGPANTLDFDDLTAGDLIADGDTVSGITFNYDFGGVQLQVTDAFDTTSPDNFLGTDDSDVLLDGDDFDMTFAPVNAIGLYIITADELIDGDLTLTVGSTSVSILASAIQQTLGDGGDVYFLGIIDDTNTFSAASLSTIGGGFFVYNVDDIIRSSAPTSAVPEPASLGIFSLIGIGTLLLRRSGSAGNRCRRGDR